MSNYFSYNVNPNKPTISFYGTEIKKDEISSIGIKSSLRSIIMGWVMLLFLVFIIYISFTIGFSFEGFIITIIVISLFLLEEHFWGRRVIITLKNGKSYRSTLSTLSNAEKTIQDINTIIN